MSKNYVIKHYDFLIDQNNDPVYDPPIMQEYMSKWDGKVFVDLLNASSDDTVLEIGVGTGRLALKTAPKCKKFIGIDISPKTVEKAKSNLSELENADIICGDFLECKFLNKFDIIYSSLTFMHIEDKSSAISKIAKLLTSNGRAVISLDKNQDDYIDMGEFKTKVYPDSFENIKRLFEENKFQNVKITETEFAYIVSGVLQ